jgi:hypothetical protein
MTSAGAVQKTMVDFGGLRFCPVAVIQLVVQESQSSGKNRSNGSRPELLPYAVIRQLSRPSAANPYAALRSRR